MKGVAMKLAERNIIEIDEAKCNGCGLCVSACHEGAIQMVDGKAKLVSDIYCDGLGDCLGPCPTGAISIITRPAEEYDEEAVELRKKAAKKPAAPTGGCPGALARSLRPSPAAAPMTGGCPGKMARALKAKTPDSAAPGEAVASELMNWPVQLRLVPPGAPYLKGADILLAADCTAFAVPDFHAKYLRNKPVIIACPKLEDNDPQVVKLAEIIKTAQPASLTVLRMEVPCCGGLTRIAEAAVAASGLQIPVKVIIVGVDGQES